MNNGKIDKGYLLYNGVSSPWDRSMNFTLHPWHSFCKYYATIAFVYVPTIAETVDKETDGIMLN